MQKSIDSFFKRAQPKKPNEVDNEVQVIKKRKADVITSDEDPTSKIPSNVKKIKHSTSNSSPEEKPKEVAKTIEVKPIEKSPEVVKTSKKHISDLNASVLSDEERHERKRVAGILYQKYKNRSSVLNPGSKTVPEGKPNCLAGLTFLITGILESLERDEISSIIEQYGGKVMKTVGKRLNYLIVGEESGPKKLAQAEELNIKVISEDEFLNLIIQRSEKTKESNSKTEPKQKSPQKKIKEVDTKKVLKVEQKLDIKQEEPVIIDNNQNNEKITNTNVWVEKYKPASVKEIIGQQGAASVASKLTSWLTKWYTNRNSKTKSQKFNPWSKNDDGSSFKAALLSGPPGIGKTTTANLVCKELGFDIVEFNASDTRSKRLLKEEVSELLSNKSLFGYFHGNDKVSKKHVLIMDEVDGMAGNEDRGGVQELIGLIKESSIPVICMCNDRNHQKIRSLANYCFDLRFSRPRLEQIKGRLLTICFKENLKIPPAKLNEIIEASNNDVRQSINYISLLSADKQLNLSNGSNENNEASKTASKDLKMGPWEVIRKVFSADEHKHMNFKDKSDLFFHDYNLLPLFVQQNYLSVSPQGSKASVLAKVARTADSLSLGDLVEKKIRSSSAWSLLPVQAVFSSVLPGEYMCGYITSQINFPSWLGKNSKSSKRSRLAQEIHNHTRIRTSGSRLSLRLDYAPFLLSRIVDPIKEKGADGIEETLQTLKEYHLLREDIDSLTELTTWPNKKNPMLSVDGRVKSSLTRKFNKSVPAYSYSLDTGVKKKKAVKAEEEDVDVELSEDDETLQPDLFL